MTAEAHYRLSIQTLTRSKSGGGPVAKSAYRAGLSMQDRAGQMHDYERKGAASVRGTEMFVPADAPAWCRDPEQFWNRVDAVEKRRDACWGREIIVSLPREIPPVEQAKALRAFAKEQLLSRGMVGQISVHDYGEAVTARGKRAEEFAEIRREIEANKLPLFTRQQIDEMRAKNDPRAWEDHAVLERQGALRRFQPHAHIMLADRPLDATTETGFAAKKDRSWNDRRLAEKLREAWETQANAAFRRSGIDARVDRRSRQARGLDSPPEPKIGLAPSSSRRQEYLAARELRRLSRERRQIERALERIAPTATAADGTPPKFAPRWAVEQLVGEQGKFARFVRNDDNPHVVIGLRDGGRLADFGDRLALSGQQMDAEASAMARLAASKGWASVNLYGGREAQEAMARAYARQGIPLADADQAAHEAWRQERERIDAHVEAQAQPQAPQQQRGALDALRAEAQTSRSKFRPSTPGPRLRAQDQQPAPMPTPGMR